MPWEIVAGDHHGTAANTAADPEGVDMSPSGIAIPHATTHRAKDRPGVAPRLRSRWHAPELDAALARGDDPNASEELANRARALATPKSRARLATAIERLVAQADRSRVPVWREQVQANRSAFLLMARRLREERPVEVCGLAKVQRLMTNGDSPLYSADAPASLDEAVRSVVCSL
jgi:hypothetical protein